MGRIDCKILNDKSIIAVVPFESSFEKPKKSLFSFGRNKGFDFETQIDLAVEKIDKSTEFETIDIVKVDEGKRQVTIKYQEEIYDVLIYFDEILNYRDMALKNKFTDVEIRAYNTSKIGFFTEVLFKADLKKSYFFQIRVLFNVFTNVSSMIDVSSWSVRSGKWFKKACCNINMIEPSLFYGLHALENNPQSPYWLHSHGLSRCHVYEIEMFNVSRNDVAVAYIYMNTLAISLLDKGNNRGNEYYTEYMPIKLSAQLIMTMTDVRDAFLKYPDLVGVKSSDRSHQPMPSRAMFFYIDENEYMSKAIKDLTEIDNLNYNPIIFIPNTEVERRKKLAKETFQTFLKIVRTKKCVGEIEVAMEIDSRFKTNSLTHENLWFVFEKYDRDSKILEGKLNNNAKLITGLTAGSTIILEYDNLIDWNIFMNNEQITPTDAYFYEMF